MTSPRQILPGLTWLITRRCIERRFLLAPSPAVTQAFGYILALAASRHDIQVHAYCVLSNHYHLVVTDTSGHLPAFVQGLNGTLARYLNRLHGRKESVFPSGSYSAVELADDAARMEALAYVLSNPAAADLVRHSRDWPGAWTSPEAMGGPPQEFARPAVFFDPKGEMPLSATLELTVPKGGEAAAFRRALGAALVESEERAEQARKEAAKQVLGVQAILTQSPKDQPAGEEKPRGSKNRLAADDVWVWILRAAERFQFRKHHAIALGGYRSGEKGTCFPLGTYLMALFHGVPCGAVWA